MLSLAMRFTAKKLAPCLDAFAFWHVYVADGASQHTFRFLFTPETAATGRGTPYGTTARQHAGKDSRQRPDTNDKDQKNQKKDQNQFDEHTRSGKQVHGFGSLASP
jgi:hypothetical protein